MTAAVAHGIKDEYAEDTGAQVGMFVGSGEGQVPMLDLGILIALAYQVEIGCVAQLGRVYTFISA